MVNAGRAILARRAALKATAAAHDASARGNKLNMQCLAAFMAAMGKVEAEDEWLTRKIGALQQQSAKRRDEQRRRAGVALREMRERGVRVRDIARLTQIGESQVRQLIRLAEAQSAPGKEAQEAEAGTGSFAAG